MKGLLTTAVVLATALLCGCVTVTTTARMTAMRNRIASLEEQLAVARGSAALDARNAKPLSPEERLRRTVALLDLEVEWLTANLGAKHAKTVDTQERRDRLVRELQALEQKSGAKD
jgi:outer membrane murein-binding lipoprotein Lpp